MGATNSIPRPFMVEGDRYCESCDSWAFPDGTRSGPLHFGVRFGDVGFRVFVDGQEIVGVLEVYLSDPGWAIHESYDYTDPKTNGVSIMSKLSGEVVEFLHGDTYHCPRCAGDLCSVTHGRVTIEPA